MSVIYLILPLAVVLSAGAVLAFAWAARRGQFDDLETPALRVLHDDAPARRQRGEPE
jgi:cbb3-type cytochrome oxidase maturation protein